MTIQITARPVTHWIRQLVLIVVALGVPTACACKSRSNDAPAPLSSVSAHVQSAKPSLNRSELTALAKQIAKDVGSVQSVNPVTNPKGTVFLFEEYHTSRVGRLQIAVMMLRLIREHQLTDIGLEGYTRSGTMDASWFHSAGGKDAQTYREDVAVRMLSEGEISPPEMLAMVFPKLSVHGIEDQKQYSVELDVEGSPAMTVLVTLAEKRMDSATAAEVSKLLGQKKTEEAIEKLLQSDPWVAQRYERLKKGGGQAGELTELYRELLAKAEALGSSLPDAKKVRDGLEKTVEFFQTADARSETMVEKLTAIAANSTAPTAAIIGAAHSEHMKSLLLQGKVSTVLVRAKAFDPKDSSQSTEQFERKSKGEWARVSKGTLGRLLNAGRLPTPITETATGKSYASAVLATRLVATAARGGQNVPDDIKEELSALPECEVDFDSFEADGSDRIFSMTLVQTDGSKRVVWVRVGSVEGEQSPADLERKLMQQISDLGGGGRIPPRKPPPGTTTTAKAEGPGDGMRVSTIVQRCGPALAVFGSKNEAKRVGRISG